MLKDKQKYINIFFFIFELFIRTHEKVPCITHFIIWGTLNCLVNNMNRVIILYSRGLKSLDCRKEKDIEIPLKL